MTAATKTDDKKAEECVGAICGALSPLLVPTPSEAAAPSRRKPGAGSQTPSRRKPGAGNRPPSRLKPGACSLIWPAGAALAVRAVLAGAYRGRRLERGEVSPLTHVVLVDAEGWETEERTLCRRVPTDHLADAYAPGSALEAPTCGECARRAARA